MAITKSQVLRVFCSSQTSGRELALVLRNVKSGERRTLYTYDRDATVVWSSDSRWIAINDRAGSDYTNNVVVSIDRSTPPIDLKKLLLQSKQKLDIQSGLRSSAHSGPRLHPYDHRRCNRGRRHANERRGDNP